MKHALAPSSAAPFSGLGGVRALAGLGCAGNPDCAGCKCSGEAPMGTIMEIVKSPWMLLIGATLLVATITIIRETR